MKEEVYSSWKPLPDVPGRIYCEAVHHDYEHFRVLLKGDETTSRTFRILFEVIVAYRNINESYRLRTWERVHGENMVGLFTVENSKWVEWLREESSGVLNDVQLTHYAIFTPEDCIEIVSEFAPEVEWLND